MKKLLTIFILIFTTSCLKDWSYSGRKGPANWGTLKEEYKFCKIGYNQSPINIKNNADYEFVKNELEFSYKLSDVEKERKNYVQNVNFFGDNFLTRVKKKYNLRRVSFNHPSEHLIAGKPYSMELQIAHKSEDEQWLMVAIFLEVGKHNAELEKLINIFAGKQKNPQFNLAKIIKSDDHNFFYEGSFTTPPCKEGVKWYVMKTPLTISKEQMNRLIKAAIFTKTNARPVQEYHPEKF